LRNELEKVNILTSSSFGVSTLRKLYVVKVLNRLDVPTVSSDVRDNNELNVSHGRPENSSVVSEAFGNTVNTIVDTGNCHTGNHSASLPENYFQPNVQTDFSFQCATGNGDSNMASTMLQTLTQTVVGLQNVVNSLGMTVNKDGLSQNNYSLENYYNKSPCSGNSTMPPSQKFGVSPEDLPHMDLLSSSVRKQIVEGRDVNLATLLIPYYETNIKDKDKDDIRIKHPLSITEFITAFGKYKRVMCQSFPERRKELDKYKAIYVEIYNVYGDKFYEHHKLFSLKSANALSLHKLKVE
jgi:hypothetical protein